MFHVKFITVVLYPNKILAYFRHPTEPLLIQIKL